MMGWRETELGDLIEIFDRIRVPLSAAQRADRKGQYPYYGAQGVIDHIDDYLFDGRYLLIPEDGENLNSRKLPIAYFAEGRFWVNNHAHIVRGKSQVADDVFLKHAINALDIRGYITGAAQPKLTQANMRRMVLRVPAYDEQRRIASILGAYDDLIEINRQRVAILQGIASDLFEEWFVRFRFPGHEDVEIVDSTDGPRPSTWKHGRLDDVLVLQRGFDLPTTARSPGPFSVISASGRHGAHMAAKVKGPGIVTGRSGTIGKVHLVFEDHWPLNTTLYVKEFKRGGPAFAYQLLKHLDLAASSSGAAVPTLNRNHVHGLSVAIPNNDILGKFEKFAINWLTIANNLERQIERLTASRDHILPRLISGQLSVAATERELLEAA